MITDEIMEAMEMMAELCKDPQQKAAILAVQDMLGDFEEASWRKKAFAEKAIWVRWYLTANGVGTA